MTKAHDKQRKRPRDDPPRVPTPEQVEEGVWHLARAGGFRNRAVGRLADKLGVEEQFARVILDHAVRKATDGVREAVGVDPLGATLLFLLTVVGDERERTEHRVSAAKAIVAAYGVQVIAEKLGTMAAAGSDPVGVFIGRLALKQQQRGIEGGSPSE